MRLLVFCLTVLCGVVTAGETIGIVYLDDVTKNYLYAQELDAQIMKQSNQNKKILDEKKADIDAMEKSLMELINTQGPNAPGIATRRAAIELKKAEFDDLIREMLKYERLDRTNYYKVVYEDLTNIVEQAGAHYGYDVIMIALNPAEARKDIKNMDNPDAVRSIISSHLVLYTKKDITKLIVSAMNEAYRRRTAAGGR